MSKFKRRPNQIIAHKTATFQIHAPTKRRQALLHDAMYRNHLAYTRGLKKLLENIEQLKLLKKSDFNKEGDGLIRPMIKSLPLSSSARSGVIEDLLGTISSYIELMKDYEKRIKGKTPEEIKKMGGIPGRPTVPPLISSEEDWAGRVDALRKVVFLEDENEAKTNLLKESKAGQLRPLNFPRSRVNDGFLLLHDPETDRYFIFLNLFSSKARWAGRKITDLTGLVNVSDGKTLRCKTTTGELFPINFSKDYQLENFIDNGTPKTAKLIKSEGPLGHAVYNVHISFEFASEIKPTQTLLGVDRGIINLASLTVISPETGAILEQENIDGTDLRFIQRKLERRQKIVQQSGKRFKNKARKAEADKAVHRTANEIVRQAVAHNSQVILEDLSPLSSRSTKRKKSNFNRMLNRTQFQKLLFVLNYKLQVAGLPKCRHVCAKYTSITCPECGCQNKKNRNRKDLKNQFCCQGCGYSKDADLNASYVIALRRLWRQSMPEAERKKLFKDLVNTDYAFDRCLKSLAQKRKP